MQTTRDNGVASVEKGLFEGLIEALANKHSQLEIDFHKVGVRLPGAQLGMELNGQIALSIHMRELTDEEKDAFATRNVKMITASN
jgi:hypothetical protein